MAVGKLALLSVLAGHQAHAVPTVQHLGAAQYRIVFTYQAPPGTRTVHLAGTFNEWNTSATPMTGPDADRRFTATLELERGRYEYKFVLDGHRWQADPENPVRTGPYDNAVLFVGVPPDSRGVEPGQTSPPAGERRSRAVNMAARVEHPAEIDALAKRLRQADQRQCLAAADAWLAEHPMPLIRDDSVSFVLAHSDASAVYVAIEGAGFWTTYDVPRLPGKRTPVFAVSLERDQIPQGVVYRYEVESRGRTLSIVDPHAWTITSRNGQPVAVITEADPQHGRIELVRDVKPSSGSLTPRDLYVYLPPGYQTDTEARCPVLYMHDGQNCWDDPTEPFGHGGWQVNLIADRLIAAGKIEPVIVVGIPNTPDRVREYGPGADILSAADHAYIRYLIRDVKPAIDHRYRTKPGPAHAFLMGSSMGALISLQAALLHPEVFGGAACLSPALWFEDHNGRNYFDLPAHTGKVPVRIYLDSGTAGPAQDGAPDTRKMGDLLAQAGWKGGTDLMRYEATGAEHNERAWRARLDKPLVFLFGR
jgi:enterochelin esterase-like enzyme